jgi:RNA polymerase sigma-70 factor (ECF subfamily)
VNDLVDHLFRHHSAKIVATLTRVFGSRHLDLAEDVVQDALVKALQQWPFKGVPENPAGWLTLVAKNRALDLLRRDASLADKAEETGVGATASHLAGGGVQRRDGRSVSADPDVLSSGASSRVSDRTHLKTACGFSTAEIARAFLTPQTTIAQRLVRAKTTDSRSRHRYRSTQRRRSAGADR